MRWTLVPAKRSGWFTSIVPATGSPEPSATRTAAENSRAAPRCTGPVSNLAVNASIQIVNVSFVAKNVAQVRYIKTERKGGAETQSRWVATIEFRYVSQPASEEARGVNPLGFQVTNYRNDPEAIVEGSN